MKPRTIMQLILVGFLVVLAPMVVALIYASKSTDDLALQNRVNIENVVSITRYKRIVAESLIDLERAARQFQILKDQAFLGVFREKKGVLLQALSLMKTYVRDSQDRNYIEQLQQHIFTLRDGIVNQNEKDMEAAIANFESMFRLAKLVNKAANKVVDLRVEQTKASSRHVKASLILQSVTVIPTTIFLIWTFTVIISRPFRQLDSAINSLGNGELNKKISVRGPMDLVKIGLQLEWLRKRLKEVDGEKQKFLRHITHELKTPMAAIFEGSDLLADEIPGDLNGKQKEVVGILQKNIREFQALIDKLLDYNLVLAHQGLKKETVKFSLLLEDVLSSYDLTLQRKKIKVHRNIESDHFIQADKAFLRSALDNLVSNAVGFSPPGGNISLHWKLLDTGFYFSIEDEGPGIAEADREKVFLPFYQGKFVKKGPIKGSGIGLSVVKECVEAHGGRVQVESSKKGAHVSMTIPLEEVFI